MMLLSASVAQLPLHDIVDDYQVSWWPIAVGWWLLVILVMALTLATTYYLIQHFRTHRGYRRVEVLLSGDVCSLAEISLRLKQVLLLKYSRQEIVKSEMQSFAQALLAELPKDKRDHFSALLLCYLERQYQPQDPAFVADYQQWAMQWWQQAKPQFKREARDV